MAFSVGFVLTLLQVTAQEDFVCVIKRNLRANPATGKPTENHQKDEKRRTDLYYGAVLPLPETPPPLPFVVTPHPKRMSNMCSLK